MTALSTLPGAMSAGLNAFSSPLGSSLPTPLLMQLLNRAGAGGMPGSLAPQIPILPGALRGAAGPVPAVGPAPQPPQNNLLSSLGELSGIGKMLDGGGQAAAGPGGAVPWSWQASTGLFGGNGPLFGVGNLFGPGGAFGSTAPAWGATDPWSALSAGQLGILNAGTGIGFDAGAGALPGAGAGVAADTGLTLGGGMGLGTSSLFGAGAAGAGAAAGSGILDFLPFALA